MPQFAVYRNKNPKTKGEIPYLLDIQSDLLGQTDDKAHARA